MHRFLRIALFIALTSAALSAFPVRAEWAPDRPVEFVVSAGLGGGTDRFARTVQSIIRQYRLMPVPVVVTNKSGGAESEAFAYAKAVAGDPHKLVFSTNLPYLIPMIAKAGYTIDDLRPVAIMAVDEFLLWTHAHAPYRTAGDLIQAARAKGMAFRMGGAHWKDTDHILTRRIEMATGTRVTFIPFRSGGEAAVQLADAHLDSNTNNPNENISYWKAGKVRPLCVFSAQRLSAYKDKIFGGKSFADIPTCKEEGIPIEQFSMPRMLWLPARTTDEQVRYYVDLMARVRETPEWKEWLKTGLQTDFFLAGSKLAEFIRGDERKHREQFGEEDWLIIE